MLSTLFLLRLPELGPQTFHHLINAFGSAAAVLQSAPLQLQNYVSAPALAEIRAFQRTGDGHHLMALCRRDLEWCEANNIRLVTLESEDYPRLLAETSSPPPLLYVRGSVENLNLPQLAVVGSRKPSASGRDTAFDFARALARGGFAITSGLALGIDGAAHLGALAAPGPTIGVLGTGIDRIYPARHRDLASRILAEGGTVVSEFPLGLGPQRDHFPRRNRIISGMSMGVLVVEAALKSGSLITAHNALQQNREVFAIPGSIHNPLSRGCHALIRQGAILVEQIADLEEPLRGLLAFKWEESASATQMSPTTLPSGLNKDEALILSNTDFEGTSMDQLLARTGLGAGQVMATLVGLELKGLVEQSAGAYQRRVVQPRGAQA